MARPEAGLGANAEGPLAPRECLACGSSTVVEVRIREFPAYRCDKCRLRWLRERPSDDELAQLYETGFYAGKARGGPLVAALHAINNAIRIRELQGMEPGRLLDVGSGKGRFLGAARDAGWDVMGIEFAAGAAATARAVYDVEVMNGDFMTAPLSGPFDAVTIWHTLEHLSDPAAALRRSRELLANDGRLIVSVPNSASLQARLGGDAWFHLDVPRHLYHFTPSALTALLARSGFEVERIGYLYPEMEGIGLIQTALNLAGLGQDTLYRFAKRDETASHGRRLATSAAIAMALAPAAVAWSFVAPPLKTGASMQVVARPALA